MTTIASRDLRNHTSDVLRHVKDGETVIVTVNGEPVAEISRPAEVRRAYLSRADVLRLIERHAPDLTLRDDLAWIAAGTTDDLDLP